MFLEHNVPLPFFICFLVVGIGALGAIALAHHYDKQLRRCKRELEALKHQHHSSLESNLNKPQTSPANNTTVKIQSKGDDAV